MLSVDCSNRPPTESLFVLVGIDCKEYDDGDDQKKVFNMTDFKVNRSVRRKCGRIIEDP